MSISLAKLRGKWRLLWGFCPACNSAAPEVDTCGVCLQPYVEVDGKALRDTYPPPKWIKNLWWGRFKAKLEKDHGKNT